MPRVLRSEAHADALREWTLAEACYSWSRYVASDNDATSAAGPDDECPCAGAARNEEYLVSCDPEATGYHLPETPSSSPPKPPSDDAFIFFVVAFACIIAACVASLAVVHRWWRREAAALEAERAARAAASNPWNMRAARADGAEGSGKSERLGGSVVRGLMYGLYVLNPSGSFSFAIEKVVTNTSAEKSAKLRGEEDAAATESGEAATDAASGEAATTADAFESESAADSETVPRGSVDPWDAVPSRADSGTTRDENEGRVRGARRGVGFGADGGTR